MSAPAPRLRRSSQDSRHGPRGRPLRRGQTLVVFALTLFVLTVMVMITLGVASRVKERMEQQTVADAAAYSQAVVTARAFNSVAVMNRAIIAQMSAIAAAQSLLSFAGYYHGTLNQARDVLAVMAATDNGCGSTITDAYSRIVTEDSQLIEIWEPPNCIRGGEGSQGRDRSGAAFIRDELYGTALDMARDQRRSYEDMREQIRSGAIPTRVTEMARQGAPWSSEERDLFVKASGFNETRAEIEEIDIPEQKDTRKQRHMVRAAMGARGIETFVSSREQDPRVDGSISGRDYIKKRIEGIQGSVPLDINLTNQGTSYFGDRAPLTGNGTDGDPLVREDFERWLDIDDPEANLDWTLVAATDVGRFSFTYTGTSTTCTFVNPVEDSFGYIRTGNDRHPAPNHTDHMWRRGYAIDYQEKGPESCEPPRERHIFERVANDETQISIWPVFVDFNEDKLDPDGNRAVNADAAPKNHVVVLRDYDVRGNSDPWNVEKTFRFTSAGQTINLKQNRGGFNLSFSLATGLAYYHRGDPRGPNNTGHAREPPNFLNPFWRATLVAGDVDETFALRGRSSIQTLRDIGHDDEADLLRDLREDAAFEAIP